MKRRVALSAAGGMGGAPATKAGLRRCARLCSPCGVTAVANMSRGRSTKEDMMGIIAIDGSSFLVRGRSRACRSSTWAAVLNGAVPAV